MRAPLHTSGLCLPRPDSLRSASASRRVRTRHNVHRMFLTESIAALNILSQNIAVTSDPFPPCPPSALASRDTDFVSKRVKTFLQACRDSGGVDMRPSQMADFLPNLSNSEFSPKSLSQDNSSVPAASSTPQMVPPPSQKSSLDSDHASSSLLAGLDPYGVCSDLASSAVAVDADMVSLPSRAGTCDILRFLPPDLAARYSSPQQLRSKAVPSRKPHCAFLIKDGHYARLLRRMDACGMLAWTDKPPEVVNGLFAVPKPDGTQRLIIDARRANALFEDPEPVQLPTPDLLANLETQGEALHVAKADLSDFYHSLRLPEAWWTFFGLPAVAPASVDKGSRFQSDLVWPLIKTLPMGFAHAVLLAQGYHCGLVHQRVPLLRQPDMIGFGNDLRADRLRWSIYIDDLALMAPSREEAEAALNEYECACVDAGLVIKPSKLRRPSQAPIEVTGLRVDGEALSVGVAPHKLLLLIRHTLLLARSPMVQAHELSSVLGKWAWAVLIRRPALSVFGAVYRWLAAFKDRAAPLWPSARLELGVICALAPLLVASLAPGWFHDTVAIDASSTGQGVVASALPPPMVAGLTTAAGLPPADAFRADDIFDGAMRATFSKSSHATSGRCVDRFPGLLARVQSSPWRTIVAKHWKRSEHINVLEATALRTGVRWIRSHRSASDCRCLIISDSAVVVSSTSKGRSSSRSLLFNCRRTAAFLLSSGLRLFVRWVPSHVNPADAASRTI